MSAQVLVGGHDRPDSRRGGAADLLGDPAPSPAAYRAGLVLELLARRSEPLALSVLAGELGLAKSSALNLLVSLETSGMVRRTAAGWVLGFKVLELSRAALTSTEVVAEFHRATSSARDLLGETVVLAVLDGTDVVYVARHDGHQPVRYVNEIGTRNPAAVTALGRAMLAGLPDAELERRLAGVDELPVHTPRSLRTVEQLRADLDAVRERGYAVDDEQGVPGIRCFGVPVGSPGTPTAVSVSFVSDRLTPELETAVVAGLTRLAARLRRAEPSRPSERNGSDRTSRDRTSPDRTSPDRSSPDPTSPDRTSPDQTSPDRTSPDQTSPDRSSHEPSTSERTTDDPTSEQEP